MHRQNADSGAEVGTKGREAILAPTSA